VTWSERLPAALLAGPGPIDWIGTGLLAAVGLTGLGVVAAAVLPARLRSAVVGWFTAGVGVTAMVAGWHAMAAPTGWSIQIGWLLPLSGVSLSLDPLGALFVLVSGAVVAIAAVYGVGYAGHGHGPRGRGVLAAQAVFALALVLVPCAASVSTFLALWELMAVTSLLLVLAEHTRRAQVASAGWWYAVMTQGGFVALLVGLTVYAGVAGGDGFAALRSAHLSPVIATVVFLLLLAGFGAKSGLVPVHVWLPRAHPEAPAPISAMLSAAMVNLGAYGLVRFGLDLLGAGPQWWWTLVMAAGGLSAVFGILQAAVATDLKRLLAYSTVENMGLVYLGIGAAGLFRRSAEPIAMVALAAALLHVVNHAAFKTLLFGAAGSVLRATGTRDLDRLGGLRSRMPVTTVLFAVGALAAAALPPGNGFVSEWLLLQSLVHAVGADAAVSMIAAPVAVALVALTAGLAVAVFTKALGVGFLARPRSAGAAAATESSATMMVGMGMAALACAALAVAPQRLGPWLDRVVATSLPAGGSTVASRVAGPIMSDAVTLRLAGIASTMSPLVLTAGILAGVAVVATAAGVLSAGVRRRRAVALWSCGADAPTPRMQYTATSFAEPLQRVFDDVLAPQTDVDVTAHAESVYLLERISYRRRIPDRIEHRLYQPAISAVSRLRRLGPVLANGSVHRYLSYGLVGVAGLLLVLAVVR
jgi:formate hydrogenlyase subunit 3/multisubunit Na+/H+ antiporter MnhD subunit